MIYNELLQRGMADFPIELYHVNKNHPRYEMDFHWHTDFEFIRVIKGELYVRLDNNEYTAKENDVLFVNPETVHGAYPLNDCIYDCIVMHYEMFSFTDVVCRNFIDSILNREIVISEYCNDPSSEFSIAINKLFNSLKQHSPGYRFVVKGALYSFIGCAIDNNMYYTLTNNVGADKNLLKLKKILSYMRENYNKQLSLEDIASCVSMSPKYFCYYFRSITQKTPIEYLISYRIEQACKQLLNSDKSITEISLSCGFNDLSYFIKTFKNHKGVTPAKYRKF